MVLLTRQILGLAPESIVLPSDVLFLPPRAEKGLNRIPIVNQRFTISQRSIQSRKCQPCFAKQGVFDLYCTLFRGEVPVGASRREGSHDASRWPTRRELISAGSRPLGKIIAKRAVLRPFPECAIIDILQCFPTDRLHCDFLSPD